MPRKKDRWPELCDLVASDDGLPVRDAGSWTEQKVHFWSRYLDIATNALTKNPQLPGGLVYLDLFAGPGVCQLRETRQRFPGSVIVAAHQTKPFTHLIACELDDANADALESRLALSSMAKRSHVLRGDCNELIDNLCSLIPDRSLTLAFIDPEGLHAQFNTIRKLTAKRSVDLLILFADSYDIVRNVRKYYSKQEHSKLDAVLGEGSNWRKRWNDLPNQTRQNTCQLFSDIYKDQLQRHLGYEHFGEKIMRSQNSPLYRIIFASRNPLGLKFWNKATSRDVSGQRELF